MRTDDGISGVSDDGDGSGEAPWSPEGAPMPVIGCLKFKTDAELEAVIQALLTAAGGAVFGESPSQTPAQNMLYRAEQLQIAIMHERAAAEAAGPEPDFPDPQTRQTPWRA